MCNLAKTALSFFHVKESQSCAGCRFTSDQKEGLTGVSGVTITTYTMIAFSGKRSEESARVMDQIRNREWGLLLMDEVHVVPAQMFRKVKPKSA